jgi:hypothetical protein
MRSVVAFFRGIRAMSVKLAVLTIRGIAFMFWVSGLYGAALLLLHGVAQLEGEVLAKMPETESQVRGRLIVVSFFLAAGFCGWLGYQCVRFFAGGPANAGRSRLWRIVFEGLVFWAGACMFLCLLILAGSLQARWQVARAYYWVAGGAGLLFLVLMVAAELAHRRMTGEGSPPRAAATDE